MLLLLLWVGYIYILHYKLIKELHNWFTLLKYSWNDCIWVQQCPNTKADLIKHMYTPVKTNEPYMNQAESRHPFLIPERTRNFEWSRWPYFCFGRPKASFGDGWLTSSCYHDVIMLAFHWPRAGVLFTLCTYFANSVHWSLDNH